MDLVPFTMKRSNALCLTEEKEKGEERRPARGAGSLRRTRNTRPETQQKEETLLGASHNRLGLWTEHAMSQRPIDARRSLLLPPLLPPIAEDEPTTPKPSQPLESGQRDLMLPPPQTRQPQGRQIYRRFRVLRRAGESLG